MKKVQIKFINGEFEIIECSNYEEANGEYYFNRYTSPTQYYIVLMAIKRNVLWIKEL
jgi:hypothetical protein